MSAWKILRTVSAEVSAATPSAAKPAAAFLLDGEEWGADVATSVDLLIRLLTTTFDNWEVARGASLQDLPESLSQSVDAYGLLVVIVGSRRVAEKHDAHLRALSPAFPFLLLLNEVNTTAAAPSEYQVSWLASSDASKATIPIVFGALLQQASGISITVKSVHESSKGSLKFVEAPGSEMSLAVWGPSDALRAAMSATVLVAIETEEVCDGRYVGGLLKHVIPAARIRLADRQPRLTIRGGGVKKAAADFAFRNSVGVGVALLDNTRGPSIWVSEGLPEGDKTQAMTTLQEQFPTSSVLTGFLLEVQSTAAVGFTLEFIFLEGLVDEEVGLRVDSVSISPLQPRPSLPQAPSTIVAAPPIATGQVQVAQLAPSISSHQIEPPPIRSLPSHTSANQVHRSNEPSSVTNHTLPLSVEDVRELVNRACASLEEKMVNHTAVSESRIGDLEAEVRLLRSRLAEDRHAAATAAADANTLKRAAEVANQRIQSLENEVELLRAVMNSKETGWKSEVVSSSEWRNAFDELRTEVRNVQEHAADHRLVESAIAELRSSCASLEGVRAAEERMSAAARAVQQQTETTRWSLENFKGHLEVLSQQHTQLVTKVEAIRDAPATTVAIEASLKSTDQRVAALETAMQTSNSENGVYRRAFELSVNRLYDQLKFFHEDLSRLDDHVNRQSSRLDDTVEQMRSSEGSIRRATEDSVMAAVVQRFADVQDHISAVKSFCSAAVERSSELANERSESAEKRVSADVHRALDLVRSQWKSEVARVQSIVEAHIEAQKKALGDLSALSPPRESHVGSPRRDELSLARQQIEQVMEEQATIKKRIREIELLHSEMSAFLGGEEHRVREMQETVRRVEDLEASIVFIESRL